MKHIILYTLIIWIFQHAVSAQFIGLGADIPISYSSSDTSPKGGFVQLTHTTPYLPNFNMGFFTFSKKFTPNTEQGHTLQTSGTFSLLELFYHVPAPFFSLGLGLGGGNLLTRTQVIQAGLTLQKVNTSGQVSAWFVQLGIPFWNAVELHISYHNIQASGYQLMKKKDIELIGMNQSQNLSGQLTAVGFQIAF